MSDLCCPECRSEADFEVKTSVGSAKVIGNVFTSNLKEPIDVKCESCGHEWKQFPNRSRVN